MSATRRRFPVRALAHHRRYFVEAGHLGGPPAPLTGDDLEAPGSGRAYHDRLDDAARPHRVRKLFEGGLIDRPAWLVFAAAE